jgi:hypothetical protein
MINEYDSIKQIKKLDFMLLVEDYMMSYTKALNQLPNLNNLTYQYCTNELFSKSIYYGNSYEDALTELGFSTKQFIPGCVPLQYKWALEYGVSTIPLWTSKFPFILYWTRYLTTSLINFSLQRIIDKQIQFYRPDVLWVFSGVRVSSDIIKSWRKYAKKIILWWSCPIFPNFPYSDFDLIVSCIPTLVKYFQSLGINAEHVSHAFDEKILNKVQESSDRIPGIAWPSPL